ncbi:MAG: ABC transporter permease [Waddliaceae bacterium]
MLHRIISLIIKELVGIWRDPKIRISLLSPPLIQLLIFTFAATLDVKNVPIGILNRDNGEQGFELVQRFHGSPTFTRITYLPSVKAIAPFLDLQRGVMVVSIDQQFSRNLDADRPAEVQLIVDGRKSNSAQIVVGYATQIINRFNDDHAANAEIKQQNVRLFPRNWFNPNLLYYWYNIPSLVTTLSMLTCLIVTSTSVARERELGTFDQLLVSPLLPFEILIGKIVPGIIVGTLEALLLMAVGVFGFGVPFEGSFLLIVFSLLIFITAMGGVGLFISSLCSTQQQAMLGTFIVMVPSVMLSGFATPIENMPQWLQVFTYLIPMRYMLIISKGIFLKNIDAGIVMHNAWPLAVIACFTLTGAGWFFRRRLE